MANGLSGTCRKDARTPAIMGLRYIDVSAGHNQNTEVNLVRAMIQKAEFAICKHVVRNVF